MSVSGGRSRSAGGRRGALCVLTCAGRSWQAEERAGGESRVIVYNSMCTVLDGSLLHAAAEGIS